MSTSIHPRKEISGFGWGIIYGSLASLLFANTAEFYFKTPLHTFDRFGTHLNLSVLGWMGLFSITGALIGTLRRNMLPRRASDLVGIWVLSGLACFVLLFQQVLWLAYIDLRIIDLLVILGVCSWPALPQSFKRRF